MEYAVVPKKRKLFRVIVLCLIVIFVLYIVLSLFLGTNKTLIAQANGEDYRITSINELYDISQYSYDREKNSIWDYYSVEYEVNTFEAEYYEQIKSSGRYGGKSTDYELRDINEVKTKGFWAHCDNIYYMRESSFGITYEVIIDVDNDYYAECYSGGKVAETIYDINLDEGWQCYNKIYSDELRSTLYFVKNFYDKEFIKLIKCDDFYLQDGSKYISNQKNEFLENNTLRHWFKLDYEPVCFSSTYRFDLTAYNVVIDLSKEKSPNIDFSLSAYFNNLNKTITCGGEIKYNYINNTKITVPDEVQEKWDSFQEI